MSGPAQRNFHPITNRTMLIDALASGCKQPDQFRIGTEHEKFLFYRHGFAPVPYEGDHGIFALMSGLQRTYGWEPVLEGQTLIGLKKAGAAISLEPGGQFELSGAPLEHLHQTYDELATHIHEVKSIAAPMGIGMMALGFAPIWRREDMPWMPKGRYKIMCDYMPKRGQLGIDMMQRTATVQVNLDFSSEADMIQKMRLSLSLQPLVMALFANSPFRDGRNSGYLSYRGHIWQDTDPDRTGGLEWAFDDDFGFEKYVDYLLDVPMYFVYRDGQYLDASGLSFRDFMAGNLAILPGEVPYLSDWMDHITTVFPDVRLKQYLEMRGADVGPMRFLCALPAFWTGLLYDAQALRAASDMVAEWTAQDRAMLRRDVPKTGLHTLLHGRPLRQWALEMLSLARGGLIRRGIRNDVGTDESQYLDVLFEIVASGHCQAERLLQAWEQQWHGDVTKIYDVADF